MAEPRADLPQGTLDLLILKVVALGPLHGYAIAQRLQQISKDVVQVQQGSLYPALHRLENRGFLAAEWKLSDTGREAKFYRLTAKGRAQLGPRRTSWRRLTEAVGLILAARKGERDGTSWAGCSAASPRGAARRRAARPPGAPDRRLRARRHGRGRGPPPRAAGARGPRAGQGGLPRRAGHPAARRPRPGPALRLAGAAQEPGLHPGRGAVPGPGHRRQHRDLHPRGQPDPAVLARARARTAGAPEGRFLDQPDLGADPRPAARDLRPRRPRSPTPGSTSPRAARPTSPTGFLASGGFFDVVGVPAILRAAPSRRGRPRATADRDGPVAVISYAFWQRRFGGAAGRRWAARSPSTGCPSRSSA